MENEKDNTNYAFKFLYAIGIILIVAGHCNNGGISLFYDWFMPYAFHLALFMFSSGYFYKDKYEYNIKAYVWKKINKLIIPMHIWNIIYGIFVQLIRLKGFCIGKKFNIYNILVSPLINGHQFIFTMGLWFVVPLFVIEVCNVLIRRVLKIKVKDINEYIFFIISLIFGMFGIYISAKGYNTGWYLFLDRILYFIPFYSLGILYSRKLEKYDKLNNVLYFAILFSIQLAIITIYGKNIKFTPSLCNDFNYGAFMPFLEGILGITFWLRIAKILEPIVKNSKAIKCIADNTYSIMVHQFIGFFTVNTIFAILSKFCPLFADFSWGEYKTSIWYYFTPKDMQQWLIIYLIAGIGIPIIIAYVLRKIKNEFGVLWKKKKESYYPINNDKNNALYKKYADLASKDNSEIIVQMNYQKCHMNLKHGKIITKMQREYLAIIIVKPRYHTRS